MQVIKSLEPMLKPDYEQAIYRNIQSVKDALGSEIVSRYYFQKGRIAFILREDKDLKRALMAF